jgi:ABC-type transporter Mla subunit MlaD
MQAHSRWGSKRRRFTRKYGPVIFFTFVALAVVGFLMYMLTSMQWRMRY